MISTRPADSDLERLFGLPDLNPVLRHAYRVYGFAEQEEGRVTAALVRAFLPGNPA